MAHPISTSGACHPDSPQDPGPVRALEPLPDTPLSWREVPVGHPLDPAPAGTGCDAHLDPYVGCADGCLFCSARSFSAEGDQASGLGAWDLGAWDLGAKLGLPLALAPALPQEHGRRLRLGGRCEPFPRLEASLGLTRACLRVLAGRRASSPVALEVCTRSEGVLEDLDLLLAIGASVTVGLPTCARPLAVSLEPHAPTVPERLDLVARLSGAGLSVGVDLHPILPGLGDDRRSLRRVVCAAASAGATYLRGSLVRVRDDARRSLLEWVGEAAPEQTSRYRRLYGGRGSRRCQRNAELEVAERVSCTLAALRRDYRLAAEPPWPARRELEPLPRRRAPRQFDLFEAA